MKKISNARAMNQQALIPDDSNIFDDFPTEDIARAMEQVDENEIDEENVTCGTNILKEILEWIVDGILPKGEVTLLFGMPQSGKSMLVAFLIALITSFQLKWNNQEVTYGKVLYVSTEQKPYITLERVLANGGKAENIFFVNKVKIADGTTRDTTTIDNFRLSRDRDLFRRLVKQVKPTLIVFDTLMSLTETMKNATFQTEVVNFLQDIARDTGCSIICIAHIKNGHYNVSNITTMIDAPSPLFNTVRIAYMAGKDLKSGNFIVKNMKDNNGDGGKPIVYNVLKTKNGPIVKFPDTVMIDIDNVPGSAQISLQKSIAAYIAKMGPATNIEIATQFLSVGSTAYINVALSRMTNSNVLVRLQRGLYDLSNDFKKHIGLTVVSPISQPTITQQLTAKLP